MAEKQKSEKRSKAIAKLNDCPTSPRKMRLVADLIRGVEVNRAMDLLRFSKKEASTKLEKLVKSAINNWEAKNEDLKLDEVVLYVKEIFVDQGKTIKRMRPASKGGASRILKRSNHVTVVLDVKTEETEETNEKTEE